MTKVRHQKIAGIARDIERARVDQGESEGDLLVVGWGSTYGAISQAVRLLREQGHGVSHLHLRNIWPLPRAEFLVPAESLTRVTGQPFRVGGLVEAVEERLQRSAR